MGAALGGDLRSGVRVDWLGQSRAECQAAWQAAWPKLTRQDSRVSGMAVDSVPSPGAERASASAAPLQFRDLPWDVKLRALAAFLKGHAKLESRVRDEVQRGAMRFRAPWDTRDTGLTLTAIAYDRHGETYGLESKAVVLTDGTLQLCYSSKMP